MRIVPAAQQAQPALRLALECDVSVIVPALNEAENLPQLARRIRKALAGRSYELIIVDDDSSDGTPAVCQELARRHPIRLIVRHRAADGLGGAVLHGMAVARGQWLVVMDADLQHPPEAIPYLLAPLKNDEADFVLGSRYIAGGTTAEGWGSVRRLNSRVATLLARPFAGRTKDPMSGFFALRRDTYRSARRLTPLGYKIALELMCKCRVKRIAEVPIHFARRHAGESKLNLKQQLRYVRHLARLYAFAFPRATIFLKAIAGGAAGFAIAMASNPALAGVLTVLAAITLTFVTRQRRAPQPSRRQLLDAERVLSFDQLEGLEKAA